MLPVDTAIQVLAHLNDPLEHDPLHTMLNTTRICLAALLCAQPFINGCALVNMKQIAYEVLAQEDCRRNQLESFCTRGFAMEYQEYEQTRREFLRSESDVPWRVNPETMVGSN